MIIRGKLKKQESFSHFFKENALIYCNLRPVINGKRDFRPDIIAFTGQGDVLVVEAKLRRISDRLDGSALRRLSSAASQLAEYADRLREFAEQSRKMPFESWAEVHTAVYTELHGFPTLTAFISEGLGSPSEDAAEIISLVNQSFIEGNVQYGLAFNGPPDQELNVPGYEHMDISKIKEAALSEWNDKLGRLHLFMIDPYKKRYSHL